MSTNIQWTDLTDNIIRAKDGGWWCQKISPGCAKCYSEKLNQNSFFGGNKLPYSGQPPELILDTEIIRKWGFQKKPKKHFVASMTDVFGEWVPRSWQREMLDGMFVAPKQTFQILTKRPEIMLSTVNEWLDGHSLDQLPSNIWVGVSTENQQTADERIPILLQIPASVRFLSCEPLLEEIDLGEFLNYALRQASRRNYLPSSSIGGVGDRRFGANLEGGEEKLGQVEPMHKTQQVQESQSRNSDDRIFDGQGYVQPQKISHRSASLSLSPLLRENSTRDDNQSQRWQQEEQSSSKPGGSNTIGADNSCNSCFRKRANDEPAWREELNGEIDSSRCQDYQRKKATGRTTENNCTRLRNQLPNCIENRVESTVEARFWIIIGGESGPNSRPCHLEWIESIVNQSRSANVPIFVKQLGANAFFDQRIFKTSDKKGGNIEDFPPHLRVREFPNAICD